MARSEEPSICERLLAKAAELGVDVEADAEADADASASACASASSAGTEDG